MVPNLQIRHRLLARAQTIEKVSDMRKSFILGSRRLYWLETLAFLLGNDFPTLIRNHQASFCSAEQHSPRRVVGTVVAAGSMLPEHSVIRKFVGSDLGVGRLAVVLKIKNAAA